MSEALKPCPFCGGEPVEKWATDNSAIVWAQCETCGAKGGWARVGHGGTAADLWNRRADLPPSREAVEAISPEARENLLDEIEEIINETHDIDVRDRHYAENIVGWLERHHPAALRALGMEGTE